MVVVVVVGGGGGGSCCDGTALSVLFAMSPVLLSGY